MTITPLGKAARPKKCKIKTVAALTGGSAGAAVDARNQENAGNSQRPGGPRQEPKVAVQVALVLPLPLRDQEPEKPKRRRDASSVIFSVSKKPRSSVATALERGNVIAEASRAAADATSSPIVQEPAVDMDGGEPICKKGRRSAGGRIGVNKEQKKPRPCVFANPVYGLDWLRRYSEVAVLDIASPSRRAKKSVKRDHHKIVEQASMQIQKSCSAPSLEVCKGSNVAVDQENIRVSTGRTPESASRRRRCKTAAKHSDRKTTRQPFMRLSPELHRLGLTDVTRIISKTLTRSDCSPNLRRLLLPREAMLASPLMSMLTQEQLEEVNRGGKEDGAKLKLLDQQGRSYQMTFKFLNSDKGYRLIGEWTMFVERNGMREGDVVELWASRSEGQLQLMLLHHAMEEQNSEETGAAEGKEEWMPVKIEAEGGDGEEQTFANIEVAESVEWTLEEMETAEGLLALSHSNDGTGL